jgi:hypothetical protein
MMKIIIRKGEYLWTSNGSHDIDSKGFVKVATEDVEIEMEDSLAENALAVIEAERSARGADPETGASE